MRSYRIAPLAQGDLNEIWDYIAEDSPAAADRLLATLRKRLLLLASQPLLGQSREELRSSLRSFSVGKYVIYYEVVGEQIRVLRVLHGSRDVDALL